MWAAPPLGTVTELQLHAFGLMLTLTTPNFYFLFYYAMDAVLRVAFILAPHIVDAKELFHKK